MTRSELILDLPEFRKHPVTLKKTSWLKGREILQDGQPAKRDGKLWVIAKDDGSQVKAKIASFNAISLSSVKHHLAQRFEIPEFSQAPLKIKNEIEIWQGDVLAHPHPKKKNTFLVHRDDGIELNAKIENVGSYGIWYRLELGKEGTMETATYGLNSPLGITGFLVSVGEIAIIIYILFSILKLTPRADPSIGGLFIAGIVVPNLLIFSFDIGTLYKIFLSIVSAALITTIFITLFFLFS